MAEAVLLDTNIVSMFLKTSAVHEDRRRHYERELAGKIPFVSFVTVAELFLEIWASTKFKLQSSGKRVAHHDLWIAAAAIQHSIRLVTNDADFSMIPDLVPFDE